MQNEHRMHERSRLEGMYGGVDCGCFQLPIPRGSSRAFFNRIPKVKIQTGAIFSTEVQA
jgi:hypothetical protein